MLFLMSALALTTIIEPPLARCAAPNLAIWLDDARGSFAGMQHYGSWLTIRNLGSTACTVPAKPQIIFKDEAESPLDFGYEDSSSAVSEHDSMMTPVRLEPGAHARMMLRWVSGQVYGPDTLCVKPSTVALELSPGEWISTPFNQGELCGPQHQRIGVEVRPMHNFTRGEEEP